jgi:hypothetical protein
VARKAHMRPSWKKAIKRKQKAPGSRKERVTQRS